MMEKKSYETYTFYVDNNGKDTNPGTIEEPRILAEKQSGKTELIWKE
jgi:hypothetical protein